MNPATHIRSHTEDTPHWLWGYRLFQVVIVVIRTELNHVDKQPAIGDVDKQPAIGDNQWLVNNQKKHTHIEDIREKDQSW